jgi:hypothetical protein
MTQKVSTPPVPDPDAAFFARLAERLTYLRNRRWVQLSFVLLVLTLAVWGFFYVRSLLPRTPAQRLETRADTVRAYVRTQEAVARLGLLRAMIEAKREPATIERYRSLIAENLELTFKRSPKELRDQWGELERTLNQLQADLSNGNEETLATLGELEAKLQTLTSP